MGGRQELLISGISGKKQNFWNLASQSIPSWNQIIRWLKEMDAIRLQSFSQGSPPCSDQRMIGPELDWNRMVPGLVTVTLQS